LVCDLLKGDVLLGLQPVRVDNDLVDVQQIQRTWLRCRLQQQEELSSITISLWHPCELLTEVVSMKCCKARYTRSMQRILLCSREISSHGRKRALGAVTDMLCWNLVHRSSVKTVLKTPRVLGLILRIGSIWEWFLQEWPAHVFSSSGQRRKGCPSSKWKPGSLALGVDLDKQRLASILIELRGTYERWYVNGAGDGSKALPGI